MPGEGARMSMYSRAVDGGPFGPAGWRGESSAGEVAEVSFHFSERRASAAEGDMGVGSGTSLYFFLSASFLDHSAAVIVKDQLKVWSVVS